MGASSRSPSPMTTVPRMFISLNALRMASTAAWSASFSSPLPITRADAIDAASVSRTASRPMFLSIVLSLQSLEQPVRRPRRLAILADADMHGMPEGEDFVTTGTVHFVFESNLHPRVRDHQLDVEQVVVLRRPQVLHRRLVDGEHDAARFDLAVGDAQRADPLVARALEEAEVVGVIDDAHLVGVAVEHAVAVGRQEGLGLWACKATGRERRPVGVSSAPA